MSAVVDTQLGTDDLASALVIDADRASAQNTVALLMSLGCEQVRVAADLETARIALFEDVSLVVCALDVAAPQAAIELVRGLTMHRDAPRVIVTCAGCDGCLIAEALQAGADHYLQKPIAAAALGDALLRQRSVERELLRLARWTVGRLGVKEAVSALRGEMVRHGLERENYSRRGAAKLLGVDRRVIQRAITDDVQAYEPPVRGRRESGVHDVGGAYVAEPGPAKVTSG